MAFKLKGMGFGKGTGYKSPQMMKKESAMKMAKKSAMKKDSLTGKIESVSEKATIKNFKKVKKDLVPKYRYTERTPQSQMTDTERAAVKGISKPQSVKPTPPSRKYGDSPNKMAKKSAKKKKDDKANTTPKKPITYQELVAYDKEMGLKGENALTYGIEEGSKPGSVRVKDGFERGSGNKVIKSPKAMKKGSAMDMKKKSAMTMKKKSAMAMKKKK